MPNELMVAMEAACASQREGASDPSDPSGKPAFTASFHVAYASTKDEDVSVVRGNKDFSSGVSLYAVADGHNGSAAARHVGLVLPSELERQLRSCSTGLGEDALSKALARAFVATDEGVTRQFVQSGCTLTAAVLSGDILTVANVGDSKAILDTGAEVIQLTADHRIGQNPAEFARLEQAGGRLARLNEYGAGPSRNASEGLGPVRLWPGGIMVGRAIGDRDVGTILLPNPHIRQVRLPVTGARLILASDGLWDSMPAGRVARMMRAHSSAKAAATQAVSSVAASRGGFLADDVTVVVVDILPRGTTDFREVCARFGGRLRTALSSPDLSTLAEAATAAAGGRRLDPAPRRGLFACFKPSVADDDSPAPSPRPAAPQYTPVNSVNGRSLNPSRSLRGGTERSVRGGIAREPSVRGCRRATTVEVLCDVDTAYWTAADFGHARSLSSERDMCSSGGGGRLSPRGVVEGLSMGLSLASLASEDDLSTPHGMDSLQRALSKASSRSLSRRNSAFEPAEKKCHGSRAAAALLTPPAERL